MSEYNPLRDPLVRMFLSLSDQEMASKRPELRAMALKRLEMLWQACEPHVTGKDHEGNPLFPDYRYVDLAVRIMDRQIRLLGVLKPDPVAEDTVEPGRGVHAAKVSAELLALEARMRGSSPEVSGEP